MTVQDGDVLEIAGRTEFRGVEDVSNVFRFLKMNGGPQAELNVFTDLKGIMETIFTIVKGLQTLQTLYRDLRGRNVSQNTLLGVAGWPTITAGTAVGSDLPPAVAGLISFGTSYPRITPRKYIGGLSLGYLDTDGTFTSAFTAALATIGAAIKAVHTKPTGDYGYGVTRSSDGAFILPDSVIVTDIPAYQRRRRQGRGS